MYSHQESVDGNTKENVSDYNLKGGKMMADPLPGEKIVISGLSGVFPMSMDVYELKDNLFNKVNMVSKKGRWNFEHPEMPTGCGIIPEIKKYDLGFFGVHERQSESLDTLIRLLQEKTVEAIFDAGMHPSDLEGSRTGVFIGASFSENDKMWHWDKLEKHYYAMTGTQRSMIAHRLSYFLKLKGPSHTTDTACSSSLYALEHAYRAIRLGDVDSAIVAGTQLTLHPFVTLQFARFGVLSHDGLCKCFDTRGNGYVRSETVGCIILQKSKCAKRMYAQLVHVKTNSDGYKEQGLMFPSASAQTDLLSRFYDECGVGRFSLSYLEAHGTGTSVGDPEECLAVDTVLTKGRKKPLLIGSVKSNCGHAEPASGICSIAKCIIAMESGIIPLNLHFITPKKEIKGIIEGRMKVVVDNTAFEDDRGLVGVNSFGFGGSNGHALLKWNSKEKIQKGFPKGNLPRLVCVSGRTTDAVETLLDAVSCNEFDPEFVGLLHEGFRKNVNNHLYRGYVMIGNTGEISRSLKYYPGETKALIFTFKQLNNWCDVGCQLMVLPAFSASIQRLQKTLQCKGVDIYNVLLNNKLPEKRNIQLLGSIVVQLGVIDTLCLLSIPPTVHFVNSYGELLSPYLNGVLTLEEIVNCVFIINEAINNNNQSTFKADGDLNKNSNTNLDSLDTSLNNLKVYLNSAVSRNDLIQNLSNALAVREDNFAIAMRYVNSLNQNKLQGIESVDLDSVVVQIGSEPLDIYEDISPVFLFNKDKKNYLLEFVESLGRLYELGYNPQISKLYPSIEFPVSRGTRMIAPYIKWLHRREQFVPQFNVELTTHETKFTEKSYMIISSDYKWMYVTGHVIDGKNLFPATGYLYLVWDTFAIINDMYLSDMDIVFENCKFTRATTVSKKRYLVLGVSIHVGTGNFEVVEGDSIVAKGRVSLLRDKDGHNAVQKFETPELACNDVVLKRKDIYKELRLRGYNYEGAFRGIQEANMDASKASVRWQDNWVTFLDNMLQLKILQLDSRLLYIPIFISNLTISAKTHIGIAKGDFTDDAVTSDMAVYCDKATGVIRSGGVTISGLLAKSITRKRDLRVPVLEKYEFVPNNTELDIRESVRVNMQIIFENTLTYQIMAVELIDEFTPRLEPPLMPIAKVALQDLPLIQPFLKIFSKATVDVDIEVENKKLSNETDCLFIIASNVSQRQSVLDEAFVALKQNGFIISRESLNYDDSLLRNSKMTTLTVHKTSTETLLLLQKRADTKEPNYVKVNSSDDFLWIPKLQDALKKNPDVTVYAEKEPTSGILGLVNCLRSEPDSRHVRGVFLMDEITEFQPTHSLFVDQLKKNMAVNVYKNKQWGTYRHRLLDEQDIVESEHCFVTQIVPGDLTSLKWSEGPLRYQMSPPSENKLVHVYYSSLNFKDVMIANGKLAIDIVTQNRIEEEYVLGMEYSGRDSRGHKVMGMVIAGGISTSLLVNPSLCIEIPDSWSLEDAATVPIVYGTLVYALPIRGQLKRGETILIHSATGAIGQAAIHLCVYFGCKIFTTVGTQEKREYLKRTFPFLEDRHIGNSRDETFEQMIFRETNGRGVDIVLNSLAEDKLVASVRCLAKGGRFIEIGKYDLANNNELSLLLFQKEASYHGVMLDALSKDIPETRKHVMSVFEKLLKGGAIRPLSRTVFEYDDIEEAFRFMTTGKHMGKILIKIREPEQQLVVVPPKKTFLCSSRFFCDPEKVYVIVGGLGGFGLELADWLVLRGAQKLVLTSRKGINNGYQDMRIRLWKSYGNLVKISTAPISTKDGCYRLIQESLELGPIDAIFNLAVVLQDSLFENQSPEAFVTSFTPKATATVYLDEITREMCPELSHFVVFSSVSCGRGNAEQTNYGMANSVMERVCERRRQSGYPALAIEWGAVGDVGLVAEMVGDKEIEIGGTLQQKISNCLQVLDSLLKRKDAAIVSSVVVAEKRGVNAAHNIVDAVLSILGVIDVKSISLYTTLAEMGMDSMTNVEIKQALERDFEVFLATKDIRSLTLEKLKKIQEEKSGTGTDVETSEVNIGLGEIFRLIGDESESTVPYRRLKSRVENDVLAPKVLLFPGVEGFAQVFDDLAAKIKAHALGLQFTYGNSFLSVVEMAESLMPTVEEHLSKTEPFNILAYSYGSLIALEVVNILESKGYTGTVICLDGAPKVMKAFLLQLDMTSEQDFQTSLVCRLLSTFAPAEFVSKHKEAIFACSSWDERVYLAVELAKDRLPHESTYLRTIFNCLYWRSKALADYNPSFSKLESNIKLYKPKEVSEQHIEEDYGLCKICTKPVDVKVFKGDHATFLEDDALAEAVNMDLNL